VEPRSVRNQDFDLLSPDAMQHLQVESEAAGESLPPGRHFIAALRWLGVAAAIGWLLVAALIYSVARGGERER